MHSGKIACNAYIIHILLAYLLRNV